MRFEEAIEEGYVIETKTQCDFFDLQVSDLQLRLSIGDQCLYDDIAGCTVSHCLNGRTEVR